MASRPTAPQYVGRPGGQEIAASTAKNLDLGLSGAYYMGNSKSSGAMPVRPKGNSTGRDANIKLNTFSVLSFPSKPVYQYDVAIGSGTEKRQLVKRIWEAPGVQKKLGPGWIWDGNKIAWSMTKHDNVLIMMVNLDNEYGKTPRVKDGKTVMDEHRFAVKLAKEVNFGALRKWLSGELQDDIPLHTITFLDGLLRQTPSMEFTPIKRQFFFKGQARLADKPFELGGGLQAFKGVYTSLRPALTGPNSTNLSVNVDVANGTFWPMVTVNRALQLVLGTRDEGQDLTNTLSTNNMNVAQGISKLKRVHVECNYRKDNGKAVLDKYTIEAVQMQHDATKTITLGEGTPEERKSTVAGYLKERYGINLRYPKLPLLKMQSGKSTYIPMELCTIQENERYMFKLNDRQTSQMINFAVTLPAARWGAIQRGVDMLKWGSDRYLQNYGLKINDKPTSVKGKVLPNPKVAFQGGTPAQTIDPRTSGRWDLRGKKFCESPTNITSWGVMFIEARYGAANKDSVTAFVKTLVTIGTGHGLRYANKNPFICNCPSASALREYLPKFYQSTGNAANARPQLLVIVVADKSSENYLLIKKYCDTVAGCASQVLLASNVQKNQAQYCSNVSMKINAKLGGYTSEAHGQMKAASWFKVPTMIIGADVTHGAPGVQEQQSVAAMTMSWDKKAIKYTAVCEVNGVRTEFITESNINGKLKFLAGKWNSTLGTWPQHVIYMRDGVSDGQYAGVLETEVKHMKNMMNELDPKGAATRKWTVVIGSKRHHIRFFPDQKDGDRNGNPLPGTLVESGCTHPWEYDFYLCSHSAIKGTARPVHYHVLLDEKNMSPVELQNMIYEASYQYVRSTTPISQHPAMYYAHLAAARAMAHVQPNGANLLAIKPPAAQHMWFC